MLHRTFWFNILYTKIKGPLQAYDVSLDNVLEKEMETIANGLSIIRVEDYQGRSYQIKGEFVEPIHLQVVCQRWWQQRYHKKYQAVLMSIDHALEAFYEDAVRSGAESTKISEQRIREWCERQLITSSET